MRKMCYRNVIAIWRIVMHTLRERYLLLYGWISVYIMRGRDVHE